jgi:hypothetical protein
MRTVPFCVDEKILDWPSERPRLDLFALDSGVPRSGCKSEACGRRPIAVAPIVIRLDLGPIVFSTSIREKRWRGSQSTAINGFDPSRMSETKSPRAVNEAVPFIVVFLNELPIVNVFWHT